MKWYCLIDHEPHSPEFNMAFDEVLLKASIDRPVIRMYKWNRPTLSVGYFQSVRETVATYQCESNKLSVIRRVTGGGLVPHSGEWTLSIAMDIAHPLLPDSVAESYVVWHKILIRSLSSDQCRLELMKAPCKMNPRGRRACFSEPVNNDVALNGEKVIGSSQRRMKGRLLNQTSIQTLPPDQSVSEAVLSGFSDWFSDPPQALPDREHLIEKALELADEKYSKEEFFYLPS